MRRIGEMLIVTICVGSSCSIRGSDELASEIQRLIEKENLQGLVDIVGAFCMDTCSKGVSIRVGDTAFSGIRPEDAEPFFYKEIMGKVNTTLLKR
jgi:NADH:ubiquinone oxidoreductase subunit E